MQTRGRFIIIQGLNQQTRAGAREERQTCVLVAGGRMEAQRKEGVGRESRAAFMQRPLSDKETINRGEPAKGIKSTHARLLFRLIKGSFLGEARFTSATKHQRKKQETALENWLRWQI